MKQLVHLTVEEISLVDKGANQGAHIVFFKALGGASTSQDVVNNGGSGMSVEITKQLEDTKVALAKALEDAATAKASHDAMEQRLAKVELSAKQDKVIGELAKYSRVALADKAKLISVMLKGDAETVDVIKELLGKLDAAMDSAQLLKTLGSSAPASDEQTELDVLVAKQMQAEPGLSVHQARAKVYRANRELGSAAIKGVN